MRIKFFYALLAALSAWACAANEAPYLFLFCCFMTGWFLGMRK